MKMPKALAGFTQEQINAIMSKKDKDRSDAEKKVYKSVRYLSWIDFDKTPARDRGTDLRTVQQVLDSLTAKEIAKAQATAAEQKAKLDAAQAGQNLTVPLSDLTTPAPTVPLVEPEVEIPAENAELTEADHERLAAEYEAGLSAGQ